MNRKKLFLWSLYDFANSIVFINFLLYFSQWLVVDRGLSDFWYNASFAISTLLLLLIAPVLAARTDRQGGRLRWLRIATCGTAFCYGAAAISASLDGALGVVVVFFLLAQFFYQLCFVFYNPMIEDIANEQHRTRASGIGQFANALGQVAGILALRPLAHSRLAPLLPAVGAFLILALPMLLMYEESGRHEVKDPSEGSQRDSGPWRRLARLVTVSTAAPLLVAFFLYNDALITVTNNYSIYMDRVFGLPDSTKAIFLLAIVVTNAIGALLSGWLGDRFGPFRTLQGVLLCWCVALPLIALSHSLNVFAATTFVLGALIGAMWATSRSYMSLLLPSREMGYGFSFYTILERCSSFVGPLTWGAVMAGLGTSETSYRTALGLMTVFVVSGLMILSLWRPSGDVHLRKVS
ncbi:MAG TPA: MFS transporter [Vicinamibacterales bacterium]|nr:MFS transporter [Vicinamibacterales bacterium]